jgi:hypothetical protein
VGFMTLNDCIDYKYIVFWIIPAKIRDGKKKG